MVAEFDLILAALRPALSSLPKRKGLCTHLYLYVMSVVFSLVLAALRTAFSSLADPTHTQFQLDWRCLF